ncbi:MAG: sugar phosphate isomerase/epimerase [Clostridia bacterium]|nr:sugar phosphate isomerase/epimerase [Clostridia bacterium]
MQTGISTASLFLRKTTEESLPCIQSMGVRNAEVFLTTFSEYSEDFAKSVAKTKGQVRVYSVHTLNTHFEPQLFHVYDKTRADAFYFLELVLKAGRVLGADHYTFHGTARFKRGTQSGEKDNFPAFIKGFQDSCALCEKYGVTLCLENVEWALYNRVGVFSTIAKEVPALRGVLDIKQARISQTPYEKYLAEMGEKITHVHISDVDENGKMCLPGQGTFDFDTLVKRLKDVGFTGKLFLEVYRDNYDTLDELQRSCQYVDEILYKNNCYL